MRVCKHACVCMCVLLHVCNCTNKLLYVCICVVPAQETSHPEFEHLFLYCKAPFAYFFGEYEGFEAACKCKCLAALHAVSVHLANRGIKLGEQALWHH